MTVALTRVIRFAPGAVLRFAPTLDSGMLGSLQSVRPHAAEAVTAARGARATIDHLDETACRISVAVDDEAPARWRGTRMSINLHQAGEDGYTLRIVWTGPTDATPHSMEQAGLALMLGGVSEVFFAQRSRAETRVCLKLTYDGTRNAAEVRVFTAPFADRITAAMRALLPGQVSLGMLRSAG